MNLWSCIVNPPPQMSDVLGTPIVLGPYIHDGVGVALLSTALALCSLLLVVMARPMRRDQPRRQAT